MKQFNYIIELNNNLKRIEEERIELLKPIQAELDSLSKEESNVKTEKRDFLRRYIKRNKELILAIINSKNGFFRQFGIDSPRMSTFSEFFDMVEFEFVADDEQELKFFYHGGYHRDEYEDLFCMPVKFLLENDIEEVLTKYKHSIELQEEAAKLKKIEDLKKQLSNLENNV